MWEGVHSMSDLILNINISESRKKGKIVLETYDGTIPHLKNRQYSGPLRNTNINGIAATDNLSKVELELIRNFLCSPKNVQINKYQHLISSSELKTLSKILQYNCLFYKDKGTPMYQIEGLFFYERNSLTTIKIGNINLSYDKTNLYMCIEEADNETVQHITSKVYVSINNIKHPLELFFEYDDFPVNYVEKERTIGGGKGFRDYGYEERIFLLVKECGWNYTIDSGFFYIGKNFQKSVKMLIEAGINVFVDKNAKICRADFSNIRVTYDIDWFDIKGTIEVEGESVNVTDLVNLINRKDNWIEYNGKIILVPESLKSAIRSSKKTDNSIKLGKNNLTNAIELAYEVNGGHVIGIEKLIDYKNVSLEIDSNLKSILRNYQEDGVRWLLSLHKNGFGGCLADDMGLGKTVQIISYLSDACMKDTRNLIVVPKTLLINWKKEFTKFSQDTGTLIYYGAERDTSTILNYKVTITTYGTVLNDIDQILEIEFDNLIIDEAQYIKNSKSKNYRALKSIKAKTRIILTGTPVENNILEYWGLMQLINPTVFNKANSIMKITDDRQRVEKIKRITAPFLLRRMKKDVLKDLPLKQEQVLYCKMESQQKELYDKMLISIRHEIKRQSNRFEIKSNSAMLNGLLYLQEICCHPLLLSKEQNPDGCRVSAKFDQLLQMLDSLYVSGHKVVVFSRFTKMLKLIEKQLLKQHYNYYYLDGKTTSRMDLVEEFEESEMGIFLISLKAGGTGLNLVSADTAIIYDPWWNPASEKQAEDRIYRIGQKNNVMIYKMIVEDSIEEKVQLLQKKKSDLYEDLLNGHECPVGMTAEIIHDLLMN